jgi:hypothetical protein
VYCYSVITILLPVTTPDKNDSVPLEGIKTQKETALFSKGNSFVN